jgi:taurine dioxygenase
VKINQFSSGCGALISNIQLAQATDEELKAIDQAGIDHGVIFFRDQNLSPEAHLRLAQRMGTIVTNKFFTPVAEHPLIAEVRKDADQQMNIGGGWHTDHSYDDAPARGSILVARELPDAGGNTKFADLGRAYDALSEPLKQRISSLKAVHSNVHIYGENGYYSQTDLADKLGGMDRVGNATHPMVIRHPDTGRQILYVNPGHTTHIIGLSPEESQELLTTLYLHVDQPEFTCSFDWLPGSVAFWDNRQTWHLAENDYFGQARLMHRITLAGSPLGA